MISSTPKVTKNLFHRLRLWTDDWETEGTTQIMNRPSTYSTICFDAALAPLSYGPQFLATRRQITFLRLLTKRQPFVKYFNRIPHHLERPASSWGSSWSTWWLRPCPAETWWLRGGGGASPARRTQRSPSPGGCGRRSCSCAPLSSRGWGDRYRQCWYSLKLDIMQEIRVCKACMFTEHVKYLALHLEPRACNWNFYLNYHFLFPFDFLHSDIWLADIWLKKVFLLRNKLYICLSM